MEDDVESTRSGSPTRSPQRSQADAPTKRMKKPLVLSEEKELEMAEWMRRHAFLYSKGMKEYKDSGKKNRLWQEKAEDLGVESGALLKVWYESVRTKVGKISDKKSGSAHKDLREGHLLDVELWLPGDSHFAHEGNHGIQCKYKLLLLCSADFMFNRIIYTMCCHKCTNIFMSFLPFVFAVEESARLRFLGVWQTIRLLRV